MNWQFDTSHYDVAQVCKHGHLVNGEMHDQSEKNKSHCPRCGEATIAECQNCHAPIKGQYRGMSGWKIMDEPPAYCDACGKPYPWRVETIEAAHAYAEELEGLDLTEKIDLKATFDDLMVETPKTGVAALRFRRLMKKATGPAREFLLDLMARSVAETTKAMMKP